MILVVIYALWGLLFFSIGLMLFTEKNTSPSAWILVLSPVWPILIIIGIVDAVRFLLLQNKLKKQRPINV